MSSGFKIVVALLLLIGLPGLYILMRGPADDTAAKMAEAEARMSKIHKKSAAPAEGAIATDPAAAAAPVAVDPAASAPVATTATDPSAAPVEQPVVGGPAPASVPEAQPEAVATPAAAAPAAPAPATP